MKNTLVSIMLLLMCHVPLVAQSPQLFTSSEGLSCSQIESLMQDSKGYIWISTSYGLSRFDGVQFDTFYHDDNDSLSLAGNKVVSVIEDNQGKIWVATTTNLQWYDSGNFDFRKIKFESFDAVQASSLSISGIAFAKDEDKLWISTSGRGIYALNVKTMQEEGAIHQYFNELLPTKYLRGIYFDSSQKMWVFLERGGIVLLDAPSLKVIRDIWSDEMKPFASSIVVTSYCEDEFSGNLIIGTLNHGILIYDKQYGKIRRAKGKKASRTLAQSLTVGRNAIADSSLMLVGSEGEGVLFFNPLEEEIYSPTWTLGEISPFGQLKSSKIHALLNDKQGNLWLGLYMRGLFMIPKSTYGFRPVNLYANNDSANGGVCVTSILRSQNGELWVGSDGGGLYLISGNNKILNFSKHNSQLTNNSIMAMVEDKRGTIWIATYLGGLYTLAAGQKQIVPYSKLHDMKLSCLAYDKLQDILYVGSLGNGVKAISLSTNEIISITEEDTPFWTFTLYLNGVGDLWMGTAYGLYYYDNAIKKMQEINMPKRELKTQINACCQRGDTLWVGTNRGLIRYDVKNGQGKRYTRSDGLPCDVIETLQKTPAGDVWIGTLNGLSCLTPSTGLFKNYYSQDGLQSNEFRFGATFVDKNGDLYFGGNNGFTVFNPRRVNSYELPVLEPFFTRLTVLNETIKFNSESSILDAPIDQATRIILNYSDVIFSLDFSVVEFASPNKIVYAYKMEGYEESWQYMPSAYRSAIYRKLPPGEYVFKLKAYIEGSDFDKAAVKSIKIRVLPPWYRSWWAYIIYTFLLALVTKYLHSYWLRRRKRQAELVELQIKEAKLRMFTNLSHEIRTPLTLVMTPLNKFREKEQRPQQKEIYNLMYRNLQRILRLVNQIMDMRKIDNGQLSLKFNEIDLIIFLQDIMKSFEGLATQKHINFAFHSSYNDLKTWIDVANFDKVIFNLLSNAFKFTPEYGSIDVCVETKKKKERIGLPSIIKKYVEIKIYNTGQTISEENLERIFQRFVRVDEHHEQEGSGIGLHLAKVITELHHGLIKACNVDDKGVAFIVDIPLGNVHLSKNEMEVVDTVEDLYSIHRSKIEKIDNVSEFINIQLKDNEERSVVTNKKNVVIVDNNNDLLHYLSMELSRIYNIRIFSNGKEALQDIFGNVPDAIITDLIMPQIGGIELCKKVKSNVKTSCVPVIVLTSLTDEESMAMCMNSGADRFLTKPVSLEVLKGSITQAISTREIIKNRLQMDAECKYEETTLDSYNDKLVLRVVDAIKKNIENSEYTVYELSRDIGLSRVHLNRKLKECMNISPVNLIKSIRLKQAAYLLAKHEVNISEVAYKVGFKSHSYFTNSFHEYFKMTPKEFMSAYSDSSDEELAHIIQ